MRIVIPKENKDVKRALQSKMAGEIVRCVLWSFAVSAFMYFYGYGYFAAMLNRMNAIAIWGALCGVAFIKYKCWKWFDRAYEGEIVAVYHSAHRQMKGVDLGIAGHNLHQWFTQQVRIRKPNGREIMITFAWPSDEDEQAVYYYEGEYVRHYRGAPYLQVISDKPDTPRICILCGTANHPDFTHCGVCHRSLIDHRK